MCPGPLVVSCTALAVHRWSSGLVSSDRCLILFCCVGEALTTRSDIRTIMRKHVPTRDCTYIYTQYIKPCNLFVRLGILNRSIIRRPIWTPATWPMCFGI